ncbi:MAG: alpha/beta hydrolase [Caulobacteraceae bacterium]
MPILLARRNALRGTVLSLAASAFVGLKAARAAPPSATSEPADPTVEYKTQAVGPVEVFYREAGPPDAPVVLLLHGYPTASHMFRGLIPLLATRYRVIAPDLPGFGQTQSPPRGQFAYTFDNLAKVMEGFTDALGLTRYTLYLFDYGAPTGFRLAAARPDRVSAIVSQNGNAYDEGLSDGWKPYRTYWREPTPAHRNACRTLLSPETTKFQYFHGSPAKLVSPDGYTLDIAYLARPGMDEIQLDLILDYRTNVALYPSWQAYLRTHKPPLLAVWGKNDPFFLPPGAEAFRRDVPDAEIHFVDAGHFALETHAAVIGQRMVEFLDRRVVRT